MFTAGAADWVVVGAAVVMDVVGEAWCCVEWQPHIAAASSRTAASRAGIAPAAKPKVDRRRVPVNGLPARRAATAPLSLGSTKNHSYTLSLAKLLR